MLKLLHLSDIHFKSEFPNILDLNINVRNELERDLKRLKESIGKLDGILIGGDIAYSGKKEEYDIASNWVASICNILECSEENVLVVPGNHDVDRDRIGKFGKLFRKEIRDNPTLIDKKLREYLTDKDGVKTIFEPLQEFNNFASKYGYNPAVDIAKGKFGCMSTHESIHWEKIFKIDDTFNLKIHGLNSVLVSDSNDDETVNRLVLSSYQIKLMRKDNVINLILCHHPPQWLLDEKEIEISVKAQSKIHLFGHKHIFDEKRINGNVRISAGAVHPERNKKWEPRYNVICLSVLKKEDVLIKEEILLNIKIYSRKWDKYSESFVPDKCGSKEYFEELISLTSESENGTNVNIDEQKNNSNSEENYMNTPNYERKLAYRFLSLPYHLKLKIANKLTLVSDIDENVSDDTQKAILYFQRAKERFLLKQLWDEVDSESKIKIENPFKN